jgi:hypothetical protein
MTERGMAQIMSEARKLHEVSVDVFFQKVVVLVIDLDRYRFRNLSDLKRMRHPIAVEVAFLAREQLRLALKAPEGRRMD